MRICIETKSGDLMCYDTNPEEVAWFKRRFFNTNCFIEKDDKQIYGDDIRQWWIEDD